MGWNITAINEELLSNLSTLIESLDPLPLYAAHRADVGYHTPLLPPQSVLLWLARTVTCGGGLDARLYCRTSLRKAPPIINTPSPLAEMLWSITGCVTCVTPLASQNQLFKNSNTSFRVIEPWHLQLKSLLRKESSSWSNGRCDGPKSWAQTRVIFLLRPTTPPYSYIMVNFGVGKPRNRLTQRDWNSAMYHLYGIMITIQLVLYTRL